MVTVWTPHSIAKSRKAYDYICKDSPQNARKVVEYPEIRITLRKEAQERLEFIIADKGVGLRRPFRTEANNSLGMQLIHTMAQQFEGTLTIANANRLTVAVRFQLSETIPDQNSGTLPPAFVGDPAEGLVSNLE